MPRPKDPRPKTAVIGLRQAYTEACFGPWCSCRRV
jgi:hypothetical protein